MTITTIDEVQITGGVDTHRDTHMAAALDERGVKLGVREFLSTTAGHRDMLDWFESFGPVERIGVESTGTYGAGLTRFLHRNDVMVIEVACGDRQARRSHGKSDPVDAIAAARSTRCVP